MGYEIDNSTAYESEDSAVLIFMLRVVLNLMFHIIIAAKRVLCGRLGAVLNDSNVTTASQII